MNPLIEQLTHRPMPAVADALRARVESITTDWVASIAEAIPALGHLTATQLRDSTPEILSAIADALASDDPNLVAGLIAQAPMQGLSRFLQQFDALQVFQEDRLLRAGTVVHVEAELQRQLDATESAALHALIDVMLQRSVLAHVDEQRAELRAASERELKYLSFLSHDLNNNLSGVSMTLDLLRRDLRRAPSATRWLDLIAGAQNAIAQTTTGMCRLLDHERLRKGGGRPSIQQFAARGYLEQLRSEFARASEDKGLLLRVEVEPDFDLSTDPELTSLALRNLIGNAIKFSARGTIRLRGHAHPPDGGAGWTLSVADEGPGISAQDRERIFKAFERGDPMGHAGVGLGLAIAAQAAKLLGAELDVMSELGNGSTFLLHIPRPTR